MALASPSTLVVVSSAASVVVVVVVVVEPSGLVVVVVVVVGSPSTSFVSLVSVSDFLASPMGFFSVSLPPSLGPSCSLFRSVSGSPFCSLFRSVS